MKEDQHRALASVLFGVLLLTAALGSAQQETQTRSWGDQGGWLLVVHAPVDPE